MGRITKKKFVVLFVSETFWVAFKMWNYI